MGFKNLIAIDFRKPYSSWDMYNVNTVDENDKTLTIGFLNSKKSFRLKFEIGTH